MHKTIQLGTETIKYALKISARAKTVRVTVGLGGDVSLTVPKRLWGPLGEAFAHQMLQSRAGWILAKIEHFQALQTRLDSGVDAGQVGVGKPQKKLSKNDERAKYLAHKEAARKLAHERVEYFNTFYKFSVGRISIKNTSSRWGSCSKTGNLNFNYKIALLPPRHADYIIVHELCHLGQFNHSKKFWSLVEKTIPEYGIIHTELRKSNLKFT